MKPFKNNNKGYSLVELIMYSALLALLVAVISYVISALFTANQVVRATRRVENSEIAFGDKFMREVRAATSATVVSSYPYTNDTLTLNVSNSSGTHTTKFYRSGDRVMMDQNGVQVGPLTLSNARVTSLHFVVMSTTTAQAVKYEIVIIGPTSTPAVSEKFYGTSIMRGFYD